MYIWVKNEKKKLEIETIDWYKRLRGMIVTKS